MIAQLVTSIRLCSALLATHGAEVSPDRLCRAAVIVAHVANEWPPELLAGIAYRESRFDPSAVARGSNRAVAAELTGRSAGKAARKR